MPPKKKAKTTQTVSLDRRAQVKLLRGRASAFTIVCGVGGKLPPKKKAKTAKTNNINKKNSDESALAKVIANRDSASNEVIVETIESATFGELRTCFPLVFDGKLTSANNKEWLKAMFTRKMVTDKTYEFVPRTSSSKNRLKAKTAKTAKTNNTNKKKSDESTLAKVIANRDSASNEIIVETIESATFGELRTCFPLVFGGKLTRSNNKEWLKAVFTRKMVTDKTYEFVPRTSSSKNRLKAKTAKTNNTNKKKSDESALVKVISAIRSYSDRYSRFPISVLF